MRGAVAGLLWAALALAAPAEKDIAVRWPVKPAPEGQTFDGSQFVTLPGAPDVGKGAFALSVWVKPADLAGGDPTYGRGIARSTRGEQVNDWVLSVHPDGRVRFVHWRKPGDDATGSHVTTDSLLDVDSWYHLVAVWDGKANRIFVNGVEAKHGAGNTANGWGTGHEVGRGWTQPGYYWSGIIADLRLWRAAPTAAEVQAEFTADPRSKQRKVAVEVKPSGDVKVSKAIDAEVRGAIEARKLRPAPAAADSVFLRRVTLDLAGRIPTVAETEAFLADSSPEKRVRVIESLLSGREMPLYWSQLLSGWLMPPEARRDPKFLSYLRTGLAANKSWDRFVREMLIARPSGPGDQYASQFLLTRKQALRENTLAGDVGRALFGVNMRCAACHDHPTVPEWTRKQFLGLSAFFARSYEQQYGTPPIVALAERGSGELEYTVSGGKRVAPPLFLDGQGLTEPPLEKGFKEPVPGRAAPSPVPAFSRREALATLALDPKSPYLKRAIVNRVWKQLIGRGLVEPVDMMHEGNAASHPKLLDLLADDFVAHGHDLRRLIAVIMQSEVYARSSRWPSEKGLPDESLFAVALLRPLDADQLSLSLPLATGYYDGPPQRSLAQMRTAGAWQEVIAQFDAPPSDDFEPTATQALFLLNSEYVQKHFLTDSKLVQTLGTLKEDAEVARRAYRAILSRSPTSAEVERVSRYLAERGPAARAEACREVAWVLFSGPEFRFNH